MYSTIRTVTSRFSLRDLVRCHTPQNNFNYQLSSVDKVLSSPQFRALLESGELYGYYGHDLRAEHYRRTGELVLNPDKTSHVDDAQVIPASRLLNMRLDGDEIEHTSAILNTPHGKLLDQMEASKVGGWSWAATGKESAKGAILSTMAGVDWVTMPGFISEERRPQRAMMESAGFNLPAGERHYMTRQPQNGERLMLEDGGHLWDITPDIKAPQPRIFTGAGRPVPRFG